MQEIELKFQIPAKSLAAVRAELTRLAPGQALAPPLVLQAAYFDTPDRKLARARSALRVRREGDDWVQTFKAAGGNTMVRVEDNRPTQPPVKGQPLAPRLGLHAGGPAELALRQSLDWHVDQDVDGAQCGLVQLYATDMRRTRALLRVGVGTLHEGLVELALDEGHIHAGMGAMALSVVVCELEIELISGHPQAVIRAGRDWVKRFDLWLDTQTKAHRGDRLARQAIDGDASAAQPQAFALTAARLPDLAAQHITAEDAWRAGLEACLAHITAHMSELASWQPDQTDRLPPTDDDSAASTTAATAPVAYQWRRGLRSLRALGKLTQDAQSAGAAWVASPVASIALQSACDHAAVLSRQLGHWRDHDALAWIPRKMQQSGLPWAPLPPGPPPPDRLRSPADVARNGLATELCLQLLTALLAQSELTEALDDDATEATSGEVIRGAATTAGPGATEPSAQAWLANGLRPWRQASRNAARRFADAGPRRAHKLRRQARQLRDVLTLFAPLWTGQVRQDTAQDRSHKAGTPGNTASAFESHSRALADAVDALGQLQDTAVALAIYQPLRASEPSARMACHWLSARRQPLRKKAQRALSRWLRLKPPW